MGIAGGIRAAGVIGLSVMGSAYAQSNVTLYGTVENALSYTTHVNAAGDSLSGMSAGILTTSRWGMRGRLWALWTIQTLGGIFCIALGLASNSLAATMAILVIFSLRQTVPALNFSYLWYNIIGCFGCVVLSLILQLVLDTTRRKALN